MASGLAMRPEDARDGDRHAQEILAAAEFRVELAREHDTVRICPVGEVDLATVGRLRAQADEALATGPGRVILDLRQTTFIDSSAIHLAVELRDWATHNGTQFAIVPGPACVQRTFEVAGLTGQLPFADVPRA